jgi:NTE family protein
MMNNVSTNSLDRCLRIIGALLLAMVMCSACSTAHYAIDAPQTVDSASAKGYSLRNLRGENNSDSLVVVLALSGGGYRAAAMAHAVMAQLDATLIRWEGHRRSLLDEVDIISAVSGGSLAAAYFALRPETFLREFEQRVLAVDLQAALLRQVFSPAGIWRQTSSTFGRSDLLQEVLDEHIFQGHRFEHIQRRRPMVYINATDMRHGQRFEFTQDQFDHLCLDLDAFPISRAVAASMAVPVVLSPITVWNQRWNCPVFTQLRPVAGQAASSRYIHLVDGGLADNTGLNALFDNVAVNGGLRRMGQASRLVNVRKRVIIVVNAQVASQEPDEDSPQTPGLVRQLRSLVNVPIDRHADAKLQHLAEAVRQWQTELSEAGMSNLREAADEFHVIEVNMSRARNHEMAAQLQRIPTGLKIDPEQLKQIRAFVREELAGSLQWQALLNDLADSTLQAATSKSQSASPGVRCELEGRLCE